MVGRRGFHHYSPLLCNGVVLIGLMVLLSFVGPIIPFCDCLGPEAEAAAEEAASCIESERRALLALRADNPNAASSWLSSWKGDDCCNWTGVGCDNTTGHVIELHLRCPVWNGSSCLGQVSAPSLLGLTSLKHLDLSSNNFLEAPIPELIGSLVNLEHLNLSNSNFTGAIPRQIGNLSSLHLLDLNSESSFFYNSESSDYYGLVSDDLHWLTRIPSLRYLDMSFNNLSKATNWLHDINTLRSLTVLRLYDANLQNIRTTLPHLNLSSLATLDLSMNSFESSLPRWLFNISTLENLDMSGSKITGEIPESIGDLIQLKHLGLVVNEISGEIPERMGNLSQLSELDLSSNRIKGEIPRSLWNLVNLVNLGYLGLSQNQISGSIPDTIGNLGKLVELDMSGNMIHGAIPESIGNLSRLQVLRMSDNNIKGEIPRSLWNLVNLVNLVNLDLSYNQISGSIPDTIGNLSSLLVLRMHDNNISGQIPETIGKLYRLQYLYLSTNGIGGEIPTSMASLCALVELDLSHNCIGGEIAHLVQGLSNCTLWLPPFNGSSDGLQIFDVGYNRLNGTIPESLGKLQGLYELRLGSNSLRGTSSEAHFANLTNLAVLDLSYNYLVVNVSQAWVPPFQALDVLNLCSCQLGPNFPAWLRSQLVGGGFSILWISEAGIADEIPAWFWRTECYDGCYLNVSYNSLKGRLPASLESHKYGVFDVSSNSLEGPIPKLDPSQLKDLHLSNNLFSGAIPSSFAAGVDLRSFALSHNRVNGTIPLFFCGMTWLKILDVSNNHLSGGIPHCWNRSSALVIIDLSNNSLSGPIPRSLGSLAQLASLHLRNNSLSGGIPPSLRHCKSLVMLDIGENMLSGSIPPWIGESLSSLKILRLRSNTFDGIIPVQLSHLTSLQVLDLAHNNLSGSLPPSFGNLSGMTTIQDGSKLMHQGNWDYFSTNTYNIPYDDSTLDFQSYYIESLLLTAKGEQFEYTKVLSLITSMDLSSNRLSGVIPGELTNLSGLHFLNLSDNLFAGPIPVNIGAMGQLESLDLSNNNLSGSIPSNMSDLTFLSHLNLSGNSLSGRIPSGKQFETFNDPSIYKGNYHLCGQPLPECHGDAPSQSPAHSSDQEDDEDGSEMIWIYASSALGFVVGFWGFVGTLMIRQKIRFAYFRCIDRISDRMYFYLCNGR